MRPLIVQRLSDEEGNTVIVCRPEKIQRVITTDTARQMTEALESVVQEGGTAPRARLDHYTVAGKTGTARKYIPNEGYKRDKYYASFVGFFPSEKPEIVISVIFNEPQGNIYGGVISGPVFREIAMKLANYLNITPSNQLRHRNGRPDILITKSQPRNNQAARRQQ